MSSLLFKRYILTKPDGSVEFLSEIPFITRMIGFAAKQKSSTFLEWCKKAGIPYPVKTEVIEEDYFDTLDVDHLMRFMQSCGYKFEEI